MCPCAAFAKYATSMSRNSTPASWIASLTAQRVRDLTSCCGKRPNWVMPTPAMKTSGMGASDPPLAADPEMLPDLPLEDFADRAAGQSWPEMHLLGCLDRSQSRAAQLNDLLSGNVGAGFQLDDGRHGLAPLVIGRTNDGAILDSGMAPDELLYL